MQQRNIGETHCAKPLRVLGIHRQSTNPHLSVNVAFHMERSVQLSALTPRPDVMFESLEYWLPIRKVGEFKTQLNQTNDCQHCYFSLRSLVLGITRIQQWLDCLVSVPILLSGISGHAAGGLVSQWSSSMNVAMSVHWYKSLSDMIWP